MPTFKQVARTSRLIEDAMRMVDIVLERGFHFGAAKWEHREVAATETWDGERCSGGGEYVAKHKEVKIQGMLSVGHKLKTHIIFHGCEHHVDSVCCPGLDLDYSEPLQIEEIRFELLTKTGKKVEKTCYVEHEGESWFIR